MEPLEVLAALDTVLSLINEIVTRVEAIYDTKEFADPLLRRTEFLVSALKLMVNNVTRPIAEIQKLGVEPMERELKCVQEAIEKETKKSLTRRRVVAFLRGKVAPSLIQADETLSKIATDLGVMAALSAQNDSKYNFETLQCTMEQSVDRLWDQSEQQFEEIKRELEDSKEKLDHLIVQGEENGKTMTNIMGDLFRTRQDVRCAHFILNLMSQETFNDKTLRGVWRLTWCPPWTEKSPSQAPGAVTYSSTVSTVKVFDIHPDTLSPIWCVITGLPLDFLETEKFHSSLLAVFHSIVCSPTVEAVDTALHKLGAVKIKFGSYGFRGGDGLPPGICEYLETRNDHHKKMEEPECFTLALFRQLDGETGEHARRLYQHGGQHGATNKVNEVWTFIPLLKK